MGGATPIADAGKPYLLHTLCVKLYKSRTRMRPSWQCIWQEQPVGALAMQTGHHRVVSTPALDTTFRNSYVWRKP
jgi:hypothetical protein